MTILFVAFKSNKTATMKSIVAYTNLPITLFRIKTKHYASLRSDERPVIPPSTLCFPRNDERWLKAPPAHSFGLSLLPNCSTIREFKGEKSIYVINKGESVPPNLISIPPNLILYKTAETHFSLEPAVRMELDGTF